MKPRVDKRRTRRWKHQDFVVYRSATAGGEGELANVSNGGVFVRTDRAPAPSEAVQISLRSHGSELELQAVVRWVAHCRHRDEGFGAELIDPPAEYLALVRTIEQGERTRARARPGPARRAPRVSVSVPVAVEFENLCDSGTLCDVSATGARLEDTRLEPPFNCNLTLTFWLDRQTPPFELIGKPVRKTETGGYAVEFESMDPALQHALQDKYALELVESTS